MSIKRDLNILGGSSFAELLCNDFCSPYQGIKPHNTKLRSALKF